MLSSTVDVVVVLVANAAVGVLCETGNEQAEYRQGCWIEQVDVANDEALEDLLVKDEDRGKMAG